MGVVKRRVFQEALKRGSRPVCGARMVSFVWSATSQRSRAHVGFAGLRMKFWFVDGHRKVWPVQVICAVLGLSAGGYYAWRTRPAEARSVANRPLMDNIRRAGHPARLAEDAGSGSGEPAAYLTVGSAIRNRLIGNSKTVDGKRHATSKRAVCAPWPRHQMSLVGGDGGRPPMGWH